jgi:hypothetical protein
LPLVEFLGCALGEQSVATSPQSDSTPGFAVSPDRPLIGVVSIEDGQEVVRYFADEAEADTAIAAQNGVGAQSLAGVWADLDWDDMVESLDRIRHEGKPTPPIEDL